MKPARIYKDNMREGVLRSMVFTDRVIFGTSFVLMGILVYCVFQILGVPMNWGVFIGAVVILNLTLFFFLTMKRDNQPFYTLIPRAVLQLFTKKQQRAEEMEAAFTDFCIQDDTVFQNSSLVRIYGIEPFDISLLSTHDREHFFFNLRQMIHLLPCKVQFLVRRERASAADYSPHFFSLYANSDSVRSDLVNDYIQSLRDLIQRHHFLIVRYYAVFTVSCDRKKAENIVKAQQKLEDVKARFLSGLALCNISAKQLDNAELIQFFRSQVRGL